jgi:hypothetical protein
MPPHLRAPTCQSPAFDTNGREGGRTSTAPAAAFPGTDPHQAATAATQPTAAPMECGGDQTKAKLTPRPHLLRPLAPFPSGSTPRSLPLSPTPTHPETLSVPPPSVHPSIPLLKHVLSAMPARRPGLNNPREQPTFINTHDTVCKRRRGIQSHRTDLKRFNQTPPQVNNLRSVIPRPCLVGCPPAPPPPPPPQGALHGNGVCCIPRPRPRTPGCTLRPACVRACVPTDATGCAPPRPALPRPAPPRAVPQTIPQVNGVLKVLPEVPVSPIYTKTHDHIQMSRFLIGMPPGK